MEIVGVVGNVKYLGLTDDTDPAFYMPFPQSYNPQMFLAVRSLNDAANVADALRHDIQAIDPGTTLAQIAIMEPALDMSVFAAASTPWCSACSPPSRCCWPAWAFTASSPTR
jgi:hypothetical protein